VKPTAVPLVREDATIAESADAPLPAATEAGVERLALPVGIALPYSYHLFLLTGIFVLLLIYALYLARDLAVPVVIAVILQFALQPVMRGLSRLHIPRPVGALLVIIVFLGCVAGLGMTLSAPAAGWMAKAPQSLPQIENRLYFLKEEIARVQDTLHEVEKIAAGTRREATVVAVEGPGLSSSVFSGTRNVLATLGTITVLLFFLLVSGDVILRRFVEILPRLSNKKQAVEITREVENQASAYLGTIGLINLAVGIATGIAAYLCGLPDPVLWGTLALALNFIPILGPLTGVVLLFLVGLLTFDQIWRAALPAGIYLVIHLTEGEILTPMLLAKRFVLNPVLVILSLVFWYWMWGIPGALLAVPMLAILKIVCDRIGPLMPLGHFLGGSPKSS
jgi:predicted PurR-regulated permease PerM